MLHTSIILFFISCTYRWCKGGGGQMELYYFTVSLFPIHNTCSADDQRKPSTLITIFLATEAAVMALTAVRGGHAGASFSLSYDSMFTRFLYMIYPITLPCYTLPPSPPPCLHSPRVIPSVHARTHTGMACLVHSSTCSFHSHFLIMQPLPLPANNPPPPSQIPFPSPCLR